MKKLMVLAAMLAMMLAMAAPAFAQATAIDEGDDVEFNAVGQNIIGQVGDINQTNIASQTVVADDDSAAAAELSQSSSVTISQSNEVGNGFFPFFLWGHLF